jgi:hypothetical protein
MGDVAIYENARILSFQYAAGRGSDRASGGEGHYESARQLRLPATYEKNKRTPDSSLTPLNDALAPESGRIAIFCLSI